jgi:hypothetical protein
VIFAKVYCYRSTTTTSANSLNSCDAKHIGNINYKHDAAKVGSNLNKELLLIWERKFMQNFCQKISFEWISEPTHFSKSFSENNFSN